MKLYFLFDLNVLPGDRIYYPPPKKLLLDGVGDAVCIKPTVLLLFNVKILQL